MKRKTILTSVICFVALVLFYGFEALRATRMIQEDHSEHQNIQKISFTLIDYAGIHGKYPATLDDLMKDSDTNSQNAMQIFHDHFDRHYDYIPETNGFTLTVSALNKWFGRGPRYQVEYVASKDHDVLKINGAISLESWIKE
jgi:hypothetical protein